MQEAVRKYPDSYNGSNVNGRSKKIEYKGIILDSSWEVEFAKWCDAHEIEWERPIKGFEYEWNGNRIYYPDFYLPEFDIYIEVKGFERSRDRAKWSSVPNLKVIKINEINEIRNGTFKI